MLQPTQSSWKLYHVQERKLITAILGAPVTRRVMLLDHERHTEKLVVQAITTTIPGTSPEHALNCYHTAKKLGQAIITSCIKGV